MSPNTAKRAPPPRPPRRRPSPTRVESLAGARSPALCEPPPPRPRPSPTTLPAAPRRRDTKAGFTSAESAAVKKWDSKFIFLEPKPEYVIDNINNGLYR